MRPGTRQEVQLGNCKVCPRSQPFLLGGTNSDRPSLDRRRRPLQSQPRDTPSRRSCEPMIQQCPAGNQKEVVWGMGSGAGAGVGTGKAAGNRQPSTPLCAFVSFFPFFFSVAGLLDPPEGAWLERKDPRFVQQVPCSVSSVQQLGQPRQRKTGHFRGGIAARPRACSIEDDFAGCPLTLLKWQGSLDSAEVDSKTLEAGDTFSSSPNPPSESPIPPHLPLHLGLSKCPVKLDLVRLGDPFTIQTFSFPNIKLYCVECHSFVEIVVGRASWASWQLQMTQLELSTSDLPDTDWTSPLLQTPGSVNSSRNLG